MRRRFGLRPRAGGAPAASLFTMPIGIRNWHASNSVSANGILQFGFPVAASYALDPANITLALTRDSDGTSIPCQMDLVSTRRTTGTLGYAVVTAKYPSGLTAATTAACTLAVSTGTYSGGTAVAVSSDLEALDLKITATGDDISSLATASFNDYVYRRAIKTGAVVCGWEGWSRVKESGSPAGQWCVRWRVDLSAAATVARIDCTIYCCDHTSTPFASTKGRNIRPTLKAGSTTLNSDFAGSDVWVSGNTGFKLYGGSNSQLPAYGGVTLRSVHDRAYLVSCAAILPHRFNAADSNEDGDAGSFGTAYTPGSIAGFRSNWGATGIDGTLGPLSGVSYNMLYDLTDDAKWKKGYDAGLKQLSASFHNLDPATGYHKPHFGTFSGMATADTNASGRVKTTHNSGGSTVMTIDEGHICDTAYAPGLLTGEMYFVDGLAYAPSEIGSYPGGYFRCQCSGRAVREYPLIRPDNMARYVVLTLRQLAHQIFLTDDGRHDKAYAQAMLAESQAFATDLFIDQLQWVRVSGAPGDALPGTAFAGFDGSGSGGPYALKIWTSNQNGEFGNAARDSAWSCDYALYPFYWLSERDGEGWIGADLFPSWMSPYYIGRTYGSGACAAFSALYAALTQPNAASGDWSFVQTWGDYWLTTYSGGSFGNRNGGACPSTATLASTDSAGIYETIYQNALAMMARTNIAGAHGHTFAEARDRLGAVFAGGSGNRCTVSGYNRWEMAFS